MICIKYEKILYFFGLKNYLDKRESKKNAKKLAKMFGFEDEKS